jgi:hypothetical protein
MSDKEVLQRAIALFRNCVERHGYDASHNNAEICISLKDGETVLNLDDIHKKYVYAEDYMELNKLLLTDIIGEVKEHE